MRRIPPEMRTEALKLIRLASFESSAPAGGRPYPNISCPSSSSSSSSVSESSRSSSSSSVSSVSPFEGVAGITTTPLLGEVPGVSSTCISSLSIPLFADSHNNPLPSCASSSSSSSPASRPSSTKASSNGSVGCDPYPESVPKEEVVPFGCPPIPAPLSNRLSLASTESRRSCAPQQYQPIWFSLRSVQTKQGPLTQLFNVLFLFRLETPSNRSRLPYNDSSLLLLGCC